MFIGHIITIMNPYQICKFMTLSVPKKFPFNCIYDNISHRNKYNHFIDSLQSG